MKHKLSVILGKLSNEGWLTDKYTTNLLYIRIGLIYSSAVHHCTIEHEIEKDCMKGNKLQVLSSQDVIT